MNNVLLFTTEKAKVFLLWLYPIVAVIGVMTILWLKDLISTSNLALGPHTISMFVPFCCVSVTLFFVIVLNRLNFLHAGAILVLFILLASFFVDVFMAPISHVFCDDSYWSSFYAHHMLEHRTIAGNAGTEFYHQPGARYYLAVVITLLGGEHRLLQLFNMLIYLSCMLAFLLSARSTMPQRYLTFIGIFFCLCLPYVAKNVVQGLSEWLAITIFFLFGTMVLKNRLQTSVLGLAFIPLMRQNYVFVAMFIFSLLQKRSFRIHSVLLFFLILLLPVFHNFYFANTVQFIGTGAEITWDKDFSAIFIEIINALRWEIPAYFGYLEGQDIDTLVLAILFAPTGTILLLYFLVSLRGKARVFYIGAIIFTIGPDFFTFLLKAQPSYYPRFQYANQIIILGCVPLIYALTSKCSKTDVDTDPASQYK